MGLSSQLAVSSLARPGVCTSSTRPASPYQGQVIYQTDTNTTLVWNGSAWVLLSTGTANPPGLELVKTQTIGSAVASVTVSDVFSSSYDNYEIMYSIDNATNSTGIFLQLGSATTNYRRATWGFRWDNTTFTEFSSSTSSFYVGATAGGIGGFGEIKLFNPFATKQTRLLAQHCYPSSADGWSGHSAGVQTDTTSFTAFTIIPQAGTHTGGTIRVYGYRNSQ